MIIDTGIGLTGRDPTPTIIDTGVTVTVTHKEVVPGHITNQHATAHHATKHKYISLLTTHPTHKTLITQKFFQGLQ